MVDLLKRWAKLEPERCVIQPPLSNHGAQVSVGPGPHRLWTFIEFGKRIGFQERWVLLGAVIEAIEAHDRAGRDGDWEHEWRWRLRGDGGVYAAVVTLAFPGTVGRDFDNDDDDSPAAALLSAYLAALEATQ